MDLKRPDQDRILDAQDIGPREHLNKGLALPLLPPTVWPLRGIFATSLVTILSVLVALYAVFVRYPEDAAAESESVEYYYSWYLEVSIMVFIGFGFLMTFLRSYSYSAVGLNFLLSAVAVLTAVVCVGVADQEIWRTARAKVFIELPLLINSNFCAAAAMISFGALLGKATPAQMLWLVFAEVPLYAINAKLVALFKALDVGGSLVIHLFGASYGLSASWVLSRKGSGRDHPKNSAIVSSDMTAMIGTLFLWLYWPSFNGALASSPEQPNSPARFFCIVNTILSLMAACCATFATCSLLNGRLNMVVVQNATLAGGVGVGSAANLQLYPAGALAIGIVNGVVSTAGFECLLPFLERTINLRDTCGVLHLHGIPGLLGGLAAGLAGFAEINEPSLSRSTAGRQFCFQLAAIGTTLGISLAGGFLVAFILKRKFRNQRELEVDELYEDAVFWKTWT